MATLTAIFQAQDRISSALRNTASQGSKTSSILQKIGNIGSVAFKGIVTAVTAATGAITALGGAALKVGLNFEASMSQVIATMGKDLSTAEGQAAYDKLAATAKEMGASTAFSSSEAADALNYLALAGYDVDKACAALPNILYLAGAGAMDLAGASDLVTDAMAALQLEANQANLTQFSDQLAKTASSTNTSVSQLGEAILTVGATAANLAGGTTELNTALGILANVGIKGAEGGTHLRNLILSLQSPTDIAAKKLKSLGVSVYDSEGKMRGMGDIFADLSGAMEGMNQSQIDNIMSTIFNKTDLAAANALLSASGDEWERIFGLIDESAGACEQMYATMMDNLKGDLDEFSSASEALGIAVYDSLKGELRKIVQMGTGYINRLTAAFEQGGFEGMVTELGSVLSDAVGVIVSYAPKLADAGVNIIVGLVDGIAGNADIIVDAALQIGVVLARGILKIAPRLGKAVVTALGSIAKTLLTMLPKLLGKVPNSLFDALGLSKGKIILAVAKFGTHMKDAIGQLFAGDTFGAVDSIGAAFNIDAGALAKVKGILTSIGTAFGTVWGFAQRAAAVIAGFIGKFASIGGIEAIVAGLASAFIVLKGINIGKSLMNMAKGFKTAGTALKVLLSGNPIILIVTSIAALVAGIVLLVKNWDTVKNALAGGLDSIFGAGTFDKVSQSLSKVGESFTKLGQWASSSWGNIKNAFSEGYSSGGLIGGLKAALSSIVDTFSGIDWVGIGTSAWEAIKSGFSATGDWIKQKVLGDSYTPDSTWGDVGLQIWETIKGGISATGDWLKEKLGYTPSDSWSEVGKGLWEKAKTGISDAGDWLKTKLGYTPSDSWSEVGSSMWEKIKGGISATGDWLKDKLGYTPSDSWGDIGASIWSKIWGGITDTGEILKQKLSEVLGKIPGFINELLGGGEAGAAGEGILTSIGESFKTSFENLGTYFEPIKEKFGEIWLKIQEVGQKLVPVFEFIGNGFLTIAKVAGAALGAIATWFTGLINGVINTIGPVISAIVNFFGVIIDIVSAVISAITGDFSGAWESLKSAFQGIWNMIQDLWTAISGFFSGIWSIVSGVVDAIVGAFSGVGAFISGIWTGIVNGLINALNWCIDRINDLTGGLSSIWTWTGLEGIGEIGHIDPVEVPVTYVPQNTADSAGSSATVVDVPVNPVFDTSSYGEQITMATDAVSQQIAGTTIEMPQLDTSGLETANQTATETKTTIEEMGNITLPDLSIGTADLENMQLSIADTTSSLSSLETEISSVSSSLTDLNTGIAQTAATPVTVDTTPVETLDLTGQGTRIAASLNTGISSMGGAITATVSTIGAGIRNTAAAVNLTSVGVNIMSGLRNGINSMRGSLIATANSIANAIKNTLKRAMQINSPSKFTFGLGRFLDEGLIGGMLGGLRKVVAAATTVAMGVTGAFGGAMAADVHLGIPAYAAGTRNAANIALVGERGPEIVAGIGGATVFPNTETERILNSIGQPLQISTEGYNYKDRDAETVHRVVIEIAGHGSIEVTGMSKAEAVELINSSLKPELMRILEDEIFEGGDDTYEF